MTTETKPTNNATDNKAVFGPLGKYAVIAVIMVSIIVTTAIMLDKQLNSAEEQIAAIESEVSEMTQAISSDTNTVETTEIDSATDTVEVTAQTDATTDVEATTALTETIVETPAVETTAQIEVEATPAITVESTATAETVTTESITTETITAEVAAEVQIEEVPFAMVDQGQQRQARIDTFKAEQKQRMADMFARIKALEAQQLDQYKVSQEKQIARLHDQVTRQEKMIEALVLRNKDLYELRAANVQRIQTNREKVLNRI